jgi:hypothetical protein
MRSSFRSPAVLLAVASAAVAMAQGAPPVVKASSPKTVVAGKTFAMTLTVTFPEGLHGYQNPPTDPSLIPLSVASADKTFTISKVSYPEGKPEKVAGEDKPVNVYEGTIKVTVIAKAPTKLGKAIFKLNVGYQECNAQSCFPPGTVPLTADVTVVKSPALVKPKVIKP